MRMKSIEQYLKIVQTANENGLSTLDQIADFCLTSEIKMASGKNYKKSNYRAVLGNLARLGFIVEIEGKVHLREICKKYLEGNFTPSSSEKGGEQLPRFGILFLECMQDMELKTSTHILLTK